MADNFDWTLEDLKTEIAYKLEGRTLLRQIAFLTGCLIAVVINKNDDPIATYLAKALAKKVDPDIYDTP